MTQKKKQRKHNPNWQDNTRTERQQKRRDRLNQIAHAAGYASWSAYETEVLNERVAILKALTTNK